MKVIYFLIINFLGLYLGSIFTKDGVSSLWYQTLEKAPWTPPGYVFGIAWTTIMVCFSFYMASIWDKTQQKNRLIQIFVLQWFLNLLWNPVFFYFQNSVLGLIVIVQLTFLISYLLFSNYKLLKIKSIFILPYFLWLLIATSLNAYIVFKN